MLSVEMHSGFGSGAGQRACQAACMSDRHAPTARSCPQARARTGTRRSLLPAPPGWWVPAGWLFQTRTFIRVTIQLTHQPLSIDIRFRKMGQTLRPWGSVVRQTSPSRSSRSTLEGRPRSLPGLHGEAAVGEAVACHRRQATNVARSFGRLGRDRCRGVRPAVLDPHRHSDRGLEAPCLGVDARRLADRLAVRRHLIAAARRDVTPFAA